MKLWRKLLLFALGLGLGTLMVQFIFGGRDDIQCNYFPNDRVLYDIRLKEKIYQPEVELKMKEANIDTADVREMLDMGKVDLKNSARGLGSCKIYWIGYKPENKQKFYLQFENCDSTATVKDFKTEL